MLIVPAVVLDSESIDEPVMTAEGEPFLFEVQRDATYVRIVDMIELVGSYFCFHQALEEVELPDCIQSLGEEVFEDCQSLKRINFPTSLSRIGSDVIHSTLIKYERLEILSLLELIMWKVRINEFQAIDSQDRNRYRIRCGADIVISNILPFLDIL